MHRCFLIRSKWHGSVHTAVVTCLCLERGFVLGPAAAAACTGCAAFAPSRVTLKFKDSPSNGAAVPCCLAFNRCRHSMFSAESLFLFLNDCIAHSALIGLQRCECNALPCASSALHCHGISFRIGCVFTLPVLKRKELHLARKSRHMLIPDLLKSCFVLWIVEVHKDGLLGIPQTTIMFSAGLQQAFLQRIAHVAFLHLVTYLK